MAKIKDTKKSKKQREPKDLGRPSKYRPIFCEWLIEHFAKGGEFQTFPGFIYYKSQQLFKEASQGNEYAKQLIEEYNWQEEYKFYKPIAIGKSTLDSWCNKKNSSFQEDFLGTKENYLYLAEYYWREIASRNKDIHPTKWVFSMKNRFGWRDRVENIPSGDSLERKENSIDLLKETLKIAQQLGEKSKNNTKKPRKNS